MNSDETSTPIRSRPFFSERGRTVIVALDHALGGGQLEGLGAPAALLGTLASVAPDGFILPRGMGTLASHVRSVPWLLTADYYVNSAMPGGLGTDEIHTVVWSPEDAADLGASGLKVLLVFGRMESEAFRENIAQVTNLISHASRAGVPVMVETTLWGGSVADASQSNGRMIMDAARTGFELGADILKIPIPDDLGSLEELASGLPVPIVLMGGPAGDPGRILGTIEHAIRVGASGVALGRNVWQHAYPAAFVHALKAVVHDDVSAGEAMQNLVNETS